MSRESNAGTLPSRYDQVLDRRVAEALRAASEPAAPARRRVVPGRIWPFAAASLALSGAVMAMKPVAARTRSHVPFGPANSVQVMGLTQNVEEFLPPVRLESGPPAPAPTPEPTRPAGAAPRPRPIDRPADRDGVVPASRVASLMPTDAGAVAFVRSEAESDGAVLFDETRDSGITVQASRPAAGQRRVVNIGTRFPATLVYAARTGAAPVPVTARVETDVRVGPEVAIHAGTTLVGQAVATRNDDRVQIVFGALVQGGVTSPIQAVALGADGEMGVGGRLLRKGSGGKRWMGRAAGALGTAVTLGLARRADGMAGTAAREIASDVDRELDALERQWGDSRSDKVLEAPAGTPVVASLSVDLEIR